MSWSTLGTRAQVGGSPQDIRPTDRFAAEDEARMRWLDARCAEERLRHGIERALLPEEGDEAGRMIALRAIARGPARQGARATSSPWLVVIYPPQFSLWVGDVPWFAVIRLRCVQYDPPPAYQPTEARRRTYHAPLGQPALPITRVLEAVGLVRVTPAPSGPLFPWERVACRLGGTLLIHSCLTRRSKVWPSGGPKGKPMFPECATCSWGKAYAARSPWFVAPPSSKPAEVMSAEQRAAKMKWRAENQLGDDSGGLDPFREAAMLSPDDHF